MGRRARLKKLRKVVAVSLTTIPFVIWTPTASAFFPPMWPVSPPVTVIPPVLPPPVIEVPPVSPPPFVPPFVPPVVPPVVPVVPPVSPPPPPATPDPGRLVTSLIGLAAAAGYALKRRKE